jgi:hypothetical protein
MHLAEFLPRHDVNQSPSLVERRILKDRRRSPILSLQLQEGYPNGKEAVLKTAGRKPLQVRILSPPFNFQQLTEVLLGQ